MITREKIAEFFTGLKYCCDASSIKQEELEEFIDLITGVMRDETRAAFFKGYISGAKDLWDDVAEFGEDNMTFSSDMSRIGAMKRWDEYYKPEYDAGVK